MKIRELAPADYDQVIALWRSIEGIVLREVDERPAIERYLERNAGLSYVACDGERIVGAVLCGTDGRRGYLQHLAVAPTHRRRGIGRRLVICALASLVARGIMKCHLMLLPDNEDALAFWKAAGWEERGDVMLMSYNSGDEGNA